jgi:hypothetical protein
MARAGDLLAGADGRRLTIGLTVPARGFSAAFAACAVVLCRDLVEPMAPDDVDLHLTTLRETPPGTPVKFHANDQIHDGRWRGIQEFDDAEMLCFETRKMVRRLPLRSALKIRLTGETEPAAQLQARRVRPAPLLREMLGPSAAVTYVTTARADCLVVGTKNLLEEELTGERFFAGGSEYDTAGGILQDLARARDLAGTRRYYRTVIVPSTTGPSAEISGLTPPVVIFDGGRAYLRWRHVWPEARQLVIIDRSVSSAEEAAGELSMAFIERERESNLLRKVEVPESVEAIIFERSA